MPSVLKIENIEAMREHAGIDDEALRKEIRALKAGDFVNLTLSAGDGRCQTQSVRITSIKGPLIRGRLADKPLTGMRRGALLVFTAAHIHSIPRERR